MKLLLTTALLFCFHLATVYAQDLVPIEIEDEQENNRLMLYAVNKNLVDLDVILITRHYSLLILLVKV